MRPDKLSEQLKSPETNQEYVEQGHQHALEVLDNLGKYKYILEEGLFLDDENGGIEFRTGKMRIPDSGKEIDGINVNFKDPNGVLTPLGIIHRAGNNFDSVAVEAYYKSRESDHRVAQADRYHKIDILDVRWEAILGTLETVLEQLDNRV